MKLMSFAATWPQILDRSKTVTRRVNCNLKPGERFQAVKQRRGLKKGQKVERGPELECVSNEVERLCEIAEHPVGLDANYILGWECDREGFPEWAGGREDEFIDMFCAMHKSRGLTPTTLIHRVEYKYVEEDR